MPLVCKRTKARASAKVLPPKPDGACRINVVMPVYPGDAECADETLKWTAELGGLGDNTLVLVFDNRMAVGLRELVVDAATGWKKVIDVETAGIPVDGWPAGPNWMAHNAALEAWKLGGPWLMFEPDCTPTRQGWIQEIEAEYATCKRQIMGTLVVGRSQFFNDATPKSFVSGVAVYPADMVDFFPHGCTKPWDMEIANMVDADRSSAVSRTIINRWGKVGIPPTFTSPEQAEEIKRLCALFHRCKDGSLIRMLRKPPVASCASAYEYCHSLPVECEYPYQSHPGERHGTCVVCLGRYGDIMNALPIARRIAHAIGHPVGFMVAKQFADILDGVSYVRPVIFNGDYSKMPQAVDEAGQMFKRVIRAQIYGTAEADDTCGLAHNRMAWNLSGMGRLWNSASMVLEFDRRDKRRERYLVKWNVRKEAKPILLVMLTAGHSGKWSRGEEMQQRIVADFGDKFQIVDLAQVKAERIYDLLGLFEVATAMVTIDSAPIHLACAHMPLPVLMLAPDHIYYAAEPRCNCQKIVRYGEAFDKYANISAWISSKQNVRVLHAYEHHKNINEREHRAQTTWHTLWVGHGWVPTPLSEPYPRDSNKLGDKRGVPYVNDILKNALKTAADNDIIVLTNSDITLLPEVHLDVLKQLCAYPATCSSRRNIKDFSEVRTHQEVDRHVHWGRDLFAFRAWWLRDHLDEIPPMLFGTNEWDNVVLNLMRRESGTVVPGAWGNNHAETITDNEMASPNVMHEEHLSFADRPENRMGRHNQWNRAQLVEWASKHTPELRFPYAEQAHELWKDGKL